MSKSRLKPVTCYLPSRPPLIIFLFTLSPLVSLFFSLCFPFFLLFLVTKLSHLSLPLCFAFRFLFRFFFFFFSLAYLFFFVPGSCQGAMREMSSDGWSGEAFVMRLLMGILWRRRRGGMYIGLVQGKTECK